MNVRSYVHEYVKPQRDTYDIILTKMIVYSNIQIHIYDDRPPFYVSSDK